MDGRESRPRSAGASLAVGHELHGRSEHAVGEHVHCERRHGLAEDDLARPETHLCLTVRARDRQDRSRAEVGRRSSGGDARPRSRAPAGVAPRLRRGPNAPGQAARSRPRPGSRSRSADGASQARWVAPAQLPTLRRATRSGESRARHDPRPAECCPSSRGVARRRPRCAGSVRSAAPARPKHLRSSALSSWFPGRTWIGTPRPCNDSCTSSYSASAPFSVRSPETKIASGATSRCPMAAIAARKPAIGSPSDQTAPMCESVSWTRTAGLTMARGYRLRASPAGWRSRRRLRRGTRPGRSPPG